MVSREPDLLFKKFIDDFPKLIKWNMSDTKWSEKVFSYLADLGKKEGFDVFSENSPYEYLLGMCWIYAKDKPSLNWIDRSTFLLPSSRRNEYLSPKTEQIARSSS